MLQHKVNTCCLHLFTSFIHVVKIVVQDCDFKWILLPLNNTSMFQSLINHTQALELVSLSCLWNIHQLQMCLRVEIYVLSLDIVNECFQALIGFSNNHSFGRDTLLDCPILLVMHWVSNIM